jgi:hypothetical protein
MHGVGRRADEVIDKRAPPVEIALMIRSHDTDDFLSGPPPEVLDEVFAAWERSQAPLGGVLELGFASEPALGRAWGELRLTDGTFLTNVSATEALAIACGDAAVVPTPVLAV